VDDLVKWLRAQLDEDERIAKAARSEPWNFYPDGHYDAVREFLNRWNPVKPDMVLREIEAKLLILDRYADCCARFDDSDYSTVVAAEQMREYEDFVLPLLALPYADRPGYREEWRP
jgi:hypothetical protein